MNEIIIETKQLHKQFGSFTAVNQLDLELESGKIHGFIGPNGAGKTTTMSLLMGMIYPTKGTAFIKGHPIGSVPAKKLLGYSPEFPSFYSDMSCLEYMMYMGNLGQLTYQESFDKTMELIELMNLKEHLHKKVSKFSTGMKKKIGLAQAMIHDPEILLLDEPTANLDPTSRFEMIELMRKLVTERNLTVLISSHVLSELEMIIDNVTIINHGTLILSDRIENVQKMFSQGKIIVKTSNQELLVNHLKEKFSAIDIDLLEEELQISSSNPQIIKNQIIKFVYQNDLLLDYLYEQKVSLDSLYKEVIINKEKEGINE